MTYEEWNGSEEHRPLPETFWKARLNSQQWEAVRYIDGPMLVLAGAGAGKTRVLTYKVAYLLQHGYAPYEVLALTFTNKAAAEMSRRIAEIVGTEGARGLWSGTFHSIFSRILRKEGSIIGLKSDFTVCDTDDQQRIIKTIVKDMGLDENLYKARTIAGRISNAKNRLLLPEDYAKTKSLMDYDKQHLIDKTWQIYNTYWERCRTAQTVDFDDMLLYTFLLLEGYEDVRKRYAERFRYILIDEYQDTNYAQYQILKLLTSEHHHICVVGDDAQSIYGFRGANIENILRFSSQYPESLTIKLEQNYRSTQTIVHAANDIISHNQHQIQKTIFSKNDTGEPIVLIKAENDREEASKICGHIKRLKAKEDVDYGRMAILYRTNAQSRPLEETFIKNNIPYKVYAGQSFYERKEIKDVLGYLRLIQNPYDEAAFRRAVNTPTRGIGDTTIQKLTVASHQHNVPIWAVLENPTEYEVKLNRGTIAKLKMFAGMIREFQSLAQELEVYDLVKQVILQSGINASLLKENGQDGESKRENINELMGSVYRFMHDSHLESPEKKVFLGDYLSEVSLLTDADRHDDGRPKVTLMTIHAAKGMEFDTVFVAGMEQHLFPSTHSLLSPREYEEERRLFYVAVTRAEKRCFLSYACSRFRNGKFDTAEQSDFIDDINEKYIRLDRPHLIPVERNYVRNTASVAHSPSRNFAATSPRRVLRAQGYPITDKVEEILTKAGVLKVGSILHHQRFGKGTVEGLEGSGENAMADIIFDMVGKKKLLLKFAVFTILEE